MSKISLAGPFPKLWLAWVLCLYAGGGWLGVAFYRSGFALDHASVRTALLFLTWVGLTFVPLELAGAAVNAIKPPPEVARTLSQCMQFMAHRTPGHLWWRGWNGFVTLNAALVGVLASIATMPLWIGAGHALGFGGAPRWVFGIPALGCGALVFWWNFHHWQQRERYG